MANVGWILFVLAVVWFFVSQRLNHRKRLQLENYAIYLLLRDNIRNDHKAKFEQWIREAPADNALTLTTLAHNAIDTMAQRLAIVELSEPGMSSTLVAHAMLWDTKKRLA